ncbi:MAG TPA: hypothetical protein VF085_09850 [Solirubrobacterales bacterium]
MDGNTDTTAPDQTARIARAAWFATFVVPLILAALLFGVKSAQAAPSLPAVVPLAFEEELEFELEEEDEAEFAEEECAIAKEEAEEGELTTAEADAICREAKAEAGGKNAGQSSTASDQCPLRSAHAHAVESHDNLKVTVGYTTSSSTAATVEVSSGSKHIATVHRQLSKSGVLRITKKLGKQTIGQIQVRFRTSSCTTFETKPTKVR